MSNDREDQDIPRPNPDDIPGMQDADRLTGRLAASYRRGWEDAGRASTRRSTLRYVTQREFRTLYDLGLTDYEIALTVDVSVAQIIAIREGLALPPISLSLERRARRGVETRLQLLRALVAAGCADAVIARVLGIPPAQVAALRSEWELPENPPPPAPTVPFPPPTGPLSAPAVPSGDAFRRYYDDGWTDAEIAAAANTTTAAVRRWRWRYRLLANQ